MGRHKAIALLTAAAFALPLTAQAQSPQSQVIWTQPPTTIGADPTTAPNFGLELVGHSDLGSRGNNAAMALAGDCAYVGNRGFNEAETATHVADTAPVAIVDISDPANPTLLPDPVPGTDLATTTSRELRAMPDLHLLVVMIYERYTDTNATTSGVSALLTYDISDCRHPVHVATFDFHPLKPHEFYLWEDPVHAGRVLAYVTTPFGPVQLEVVDLTNPASPTLLAVWDGLYPQASAQELDNGPAIGNYLHSLTLSPDGKTAYLAYWDGGYYTLDTTTVANGDANPVLAESILAEQLQSHGVNYTLRTNGNTHSAVPVPGRPVTILTDEQYDGVGECPYGWLHVVDRTNAANPVISSEYKLPQNTPGWCDSHVVRPTELPVPLQINVIGQVANTGWVSPHDATYSSHNLTVTQNLVVLSWHAGGLQVVDTSDPARLAQTAQYVPTGIPCVTPAPFSQAVTQCAKPVPAALQQYFGNNNVLMWSYPVIRDGLIYVIDIRNGLYVLRYTGAHADELNVAMLEGNSNASTAAITPAVVAPPGPFGVVAPPHIVRFADQAPAIAAKARPLTGRELFFCQV